MLIIPLILAILFTPLSFFVILYALKVPDTPTLKGSAWVSGIGTLGLGIYFILRTLEVVQPEEPLANLTVGICFIMFISGLYPIFGTPVVVELTKSDKHKK